MTVKIIGTVKRVGPVVTRGANNFQFRELVVTTLEDYPTTLSVEFTGDRMGRLDGFAVGTPVEIRAGLSGREFEKDGAKRVFMSLRGLGIGRAGATAPQESTPAPQPSAPKADPVTADSDNLPF